MGDTNTDNKIKLSVDLDWTGLSGPIKTNSGSEAITFWSADGYDTTYEVGLNDNHLKRTHWGNAALRFGGHYDFLKNDQGGALRVEVLPFGVAWRQSDYQARELDSRGEQNYQQGDAAQRDLNSLQTNEIGWSGAVKVGYVVPKLRMPAGFEFHWDVSAIAFSNPRNDGIFATGGDNKHNPNWEEAEDGHFAPATGGIGFGPYFGPIGLQFDYRGPISQGTNIRKATYPGGEEKAVHGYSYGGAEEPIPYYAERKGNWSLGLNINLGELIRWGVEKDTPRRKAAKAVSDAEWATDDEVKQEKIGVAQSQVQALQSEENKARLQQRLDAVSKKK